MLKEERQDKILKLLQKEDIVDNEKVSEKLNIPMTTLRRDINELEEKGKITKLHGGIRINKPSLVMEEFINSKLTVDVKEKEKAAQYAVDNIKQNDCIFIDAGSSTFYITKLLDPNLNLSIVTNSLIHAQNLMNNGHKNIYLLGGKLNINLDSIVGYEAIQALKNYNFDKAFIGINAIDEKGNLYTTSSEQAQLKEEIMEVANNTYIVTTESKFNQKSFYKVNMNSKVEIITEKGGK